MSQNILNEVTFFAHSFLLGIAISFVYDGFVVLRRVAMPQALGYGNQIAAMGQRNAGACVAELVRVEIMDSIPLFQLLKISSRSLRIHRFWASLLGKYKL